MPGSTFTEVYRFLLKAEDIITFALDNQSEDTSVIDWPTFFEMLYVPRGDEEEEELKKVFDDASRMALVVAPRGGGKTTFLLNRILKYREAGGAYYFFDFKEKAGAFEGIARDWPRRVHEVQAILKADLYDLHVGDDRRENNRFIAQAFEMFYSHEKVRLALKLSATTDIDLEAEPLLSVLQERPDIALELDSFVHAKLSFGEMVQVLMQLNEWDQFVVCFDNVDRLKADLQPYLLSLAIDVYHRGRGVFGTVASLREKNVLRYSEEGGNGDVIEVITPTGVPERVRRLDLTLPEDAFVKRLLTVRQEYAQDVYILQSLGIQDSEFKVIYAAAADKVNESFIKQRLYNLANHSCRIMLILSSGFARYLVRLVYDDKVEFADGQLKLSEIDCRSYLYRWCYASTNPKHEWLRDPIDNYRRYERGAIQLASDCDLEWVILAWLQNNIMKLRVLNVTKAFEKLGVAPSRVRAAIYALYDCEQISRRYVELGTVEAKLDQEEILPGTLLYITPLGIEFIRNTVTKFEFILQAIRYPDASPEDCEAMLRPLNHKSESAVKLVYDHLRSMAVAHSAALKEFRSESTNEDSWEEFYRASFCIGGHLILERIASSHMAHLRQVDTQIAEHAETFYRRLLEEYYRLAEIDRDPNQVIG